MIRTLALATTALALAAPALAAEGMWLPSQTPAIAAELKSAGLQLDPVQLGNLQKAPLNAIASLGNCSASFVSPQGLLVTNHHCVFGSIQYNAKPGADYITDGFYAASLTDELPAAPGSRIYVIEDLRDVTADVTKGLAKLTAAARQDRIESARKRLIAACEKQPGRRCDVRAYFGGAQYWLQQQLEIKDVRLVYAPALGIGNFGGETDNWQWPRHTGDWGYYRAYVGKDGSSATYSKDNVPYRPKSWLKVAQAGLKDGDFVMVAGFPGTTNRYRTLAETRFTYASYYPEYQKFLADYSDEITEATAGDRGAQILYASVLKSADNYKKNTLGKLDGAEAIGLVAMKAAEEKAYRDWIAADPKRQAQYGPSIAALDKVVEEENPASVIQMRRNALDRAQLLLAARTAYRWAKEREKPDVARAVGFQDRDRQSVIDRLTAVERRFQPRVDRILFEHALTVYRQSPAAERDAAFEAKLAEIGMDRLYAGTTLTDTATRIGWLDKPVAAFAASPDPFIQLAIAMWPGDEAWRAGQADRDGRDQQARSVYMRGLIAYNAERGRTLFPDANGSLRFTYGKVTGRTNDGVTWAPFTTVQGIVAKNRGTGEFNAPKAQLAAIAAKDYGRWAAPELGTVPVDFLSTVDTTGGNSGSATLNAKGELVGLLFDGTIDGVVSDWGFVDAINRSIQVDTRYMLWTMEKVDHADRLLAEMGVK